MQAFESISKEPSVRLLTVVRQESPVTLAREMLWRTRRHWRQRHLREKLERVSCPVVYSPIGYYQPALAELSEKQTKIILQYADSICAGQFPWFAYGPVYLGFPPAWNLDFVSGGAWPDLRAPAIQVVRHDGSDVKVPWDLSRLQFLPVLGKAWRVSGERRYREAGKDLLSDWIEKNPVGVGANWTIAMEAALRAVSICLFLELLSPYNSEEQSWLTNISKCLWHHWLFIEAHNEFSHLVRSNHYLSNIVGLFCLAAFLRGPQTEQRQRYYQALIAREMLRQVYADGGHNEASTGYHLLCLEMFTHAYLVMRSLGTEPSSAFTIRLRSMYRFLAALADARGRVPLLGDCDDGRVELFTDDLKQMLETQSDKRHSLSVSSLLGVGESLFDESYGGEESEGSWFRPVSRSQSGRSSTAHGPRSRTFASSGLAVAQSKNLEVLFAAMPNGINGKGSHTHCDKLSLIVRIDDAEIFTDSGTGCYTRNAGMRNHFRSTETHNTVQIDGEEQNRFSVSQAGLFRTCDDAHVSPIEVEESGGTTVLRSSHDGYRRLGVKHARTLQLTPQPSLIVEDILSGSGDHSFRAFFHLGRSRDATIDQASGQEIRCHIAHGSRVVRLSCRAAVQLEMSCIPSMRSPAYGLIHEAKTIVVSGRFHSSLQLYSFIHVEG